MQHLPALFDASIIMAVKPTSTMDRQLSTMPTHWYLFRISFSTNCFKIATNTMAEPDEGNDRTEHSYLNKLQWRKRELSLLIGLYL